MNGVIDIENFLINLNEEERQGLINLLSKQKIIEFIKKNQKRFSRELAGIRVDYKSTLLQQKLLQIVFRRIEQNDKVMISFISRLCHERHMQLAKYIDEQLKEEKILARAIETRDTKMYKQIIEVVLNELDEKSTMLLFKMSGVEWKAKQEKEIEKVINETIKYREFRKQVENEYAEKLTTLHKIEMQTLEDKYQKMIKKEKDIVNTLKQQISELKNDKINQVKELKKQLDSAVKKIEQHKQEYKEIERKKEQSDKNSRKEIEKLESKSAEITEKLELLNVDYTKLKDDLQVKDFCILELEDKLEERYEKYSEEYEIKWNVEYQVLIEEKNKLVIERDNLLADYEEIQNNIAQTTQEADGLKDKINHYNQILTNFIENIDEKLITSALESSFIKANVPNQTMELATSLKPLVKESMELEEVEICEEIDSLIDYIGANLENIGVKKNVDELADYIVGILAAGISPLILGYKSREVANAISCAYAGQLPEIITLPGGYNDINELIDLYKKSNADVILIEGAIGQMNEHTVLPLLKEHMEFSQKDKILLFSCEDERSSELMPLYLWDYLAIIKPRNIRPVIKKEYDYSDGREVLHGLRMELEQSHVDQAYKKLRRLFEDTSIAEGYVMTRSIVLAYIYQVSNMERALECLAQGELYLFGKHQQLQEQIQKNITSFPNDFSTSLMKYAVGE